MNQTIVVAGERQRIRALHLIGEELPIEPVHEIIIREHDNDRTAKQNRLQFLWLNAAVEQLMDESLEQKRAYCKLHFGVGIVKAGTSKTAEKFRDVYDRVIRPLPYEQKLILMVPPIDLPVTKLMNTKQFTEYLDLVQHHFAGLGVVLPVPDDLYFEAMGRAA